MISTYAYSVPFGNEFCAVLDDIYNKLNSGFRGKYESLREMHLQIIKSFGYKAEDFVLDGLPFSEYTFTK